MNRTLILSAILGLLAGITSAPAQAPATYSPENEVTMAVSGVDAPAGQLWVTTEYLMWWLRGDRLPPLATLSPLGTSLPDAGVLGVPSTQILFGNKSVNADCRSGGRINFGYWLDPEQTWGVEASYFMLEGLAQNFRAQSSGDPILSRPFLNAASQAPDAQLVAFPGILSGTVSASVGSSSLLGAEALVRRNLLAWRGCQGQFRVDALAGYRFLYQDERLSIQEDLTATNPNGPVPAGTTFVVRDKFATHNVFHGGELGLAAGVRSGPWSVDVLTKLAIGGNAQTLTISGSTEATLPGGTPTVLPGGLLALISNSGRHSECSFSLVPELDLNVGYWVTNNVRLTAGYTLLFWTNVITPGEQIDLAINPNLLPPVLPGGVQHPAAYFNRSPFWAQGLSLGLELRF